MDRRQFLKGVAGVVGAGLVSAVPIQEAVAVEPVAPVKPKPFIQNYFHTFQAPVSWDEPATATPLADIFQLQARILQSPPPGETFLDKDVRVICTRRSCELIQLNRNPLDLYGRRSSGGLGWISDSRTGERVLTTYYNAAQLSCLIEADGGPRLLVCDGASSAICEEHRLAGKLAGPEKLFGMMGDENPSVVFATPSRTLAVLIVAGPRQKGPVWLGSVLPSLH